MLKMLEAIFAGKIATENIDTTGHKRLRGELSCGAGCDGCGKCAEACPFHLIVKPEGAEYASKCTACGICVKACPMEILEVVEK